MWYVVLQWSSFCPNRFADRFIDEEFNTDTLCDLEKRLNTGEAIKVLFATSTPASSVDTEDEEMEGVSPFSPLAKKRITN